MAFDAQVVSSLAYGNHLAASGPLGVAPLALEGFPAFWHKESALGHLMLSLAPIGNHPFLHGALGSSTGDGCWGAAVWLLRCLQPSGVITVCRPFQCRPRKYLFRHRESILILLSQNQSIYLTVCCISFLSGSTFGFLYSHNYLFALSHNILKIVSKI